MLMLDECPLEDEHLDHLTKLRSHPLLRLQKSTIGDGAIEHLAAYGSMEGHETIADLDLSGTRVGDEGLKKLRPWRGLNRVQLQGTKVSENAAKEFSFQHPNVAFLGEWKGFRSFPEKNGFYKAGYALPFGLSYETRAVAEAYQQWRNTHGLGQDEEISRRVQKPRLDHVDGEIDGK
jgi:hypothetical protein